MGYYYLAVDWAETAVKKIVDGGDSTLDLTTAEIQVSTAKAVVRRAFNLAWFLANSCDSVLYLLFTAR